MSIGVRPDARGQGVGQMLVTALIAEAARRGIGLCLNVRSTNPARRLYERLGGVRRRSGRRKTQTAEPTQGPQLQSKVFRDLLFPVP